MAVLSVHDLSKRFGGTKALDKLNLSVREGEVLALLGPTGAGKTTTLRTICGLEKPDAGRVELDGQDITHDTARARDFAVVFEGFNLLPPLSVFDNIAFPLRSPVYREEPDEIDRRVKRAAADLKIDHLLDRRVNQLSGGERQRVAIARALVRRPRVFLLDEPLSALDLKLREALQLELKRVHENYGATVVYASHDFPSAAELADRLALIEDGRVLQVGTLDELIADPRHASVGRLVGSPGMALFHAEIAGGTARLDDSEITLPMPGAPQGRILVGVWPEDIAVTRQPDAGATRGTVYATDFRGHDRAVEIRFGSHAVRKVVPLDFAAEQGETIGFTIDPATAFLFDATSGARIEITGAAA
ncbi:MAG: ABC transporter ATP-binding protein [Acuticoccus sp.]